MKIKFTIITDNSWMTRDQWLRLVMSSPCDITHDACHTNLDDIKVVETMVDGSEQQLRQDVFDSFPEAVARQLQQVKESRI